MSTITKNVAEKAESIQEKRQRLEDLHAMHRELRSLFGCIEAAMAKYDLVTERQFDCPTVDWGDMWSAIQADIEDLEGQLYAQGYATIQQREAANADAAVELLRAFVASYDDDGQSDVTALVEEAQAIVSRVGGSVVTDAKPAASAPGPIEREWPGLTDPKAICFVMPDDVMEPSIREGEKLWCSPRLLGHEGVVSGAVYLLELPGNNNRRVVRKVVLDEGTPQGHIELYGNVGGENQGVTLVRDEVFLIGRVVGKIQDIN